jgi:hypothetical protein
VDGRRRRAEEIEQLSLQPGFWNEQKKAQALTKEKSLCEELVKS